MFFDPTETLIFVFFFYKQQKISEIKKNKQITCASSQQVNPLYLVSKCGQYVDNNVFPLSLSGFAVPL